jgi:hypothetical protein
VTAIHRTPALGPDPEREPSEVQPPGKPPARSRALRWPRLAPNLPITSAFTRKQKWRKPAVKSSTVLMLQLARPDTRDVLAVTGTGIPLLANCYAASHGLWPVILVAALIVAVSLGAYGPLRCRGED